MSDDKAFSMLEVYGVPRKRARSIANGIEVLATRYRRDVEAQTYRAQALHQALRRVCVSSPTEGARDVGSCVLCHSRWESYEAEKHAHGCLGAPDLISASAEIETLLHAAEHGLSLMIGRSYKDVTDENPNGMPDGPPKLYHRCKGCEAALKLLQARGIYTDVLVVETK